MPFVLLGWFTPTWQKIASVLGVELGCCVPYSAFPTAMHQVLMHLEKNECVVSECLNTKCIAIIYCFCTDLTEINTCCFLFM